MANFKLDRIRFRWKGEWTISTEYIKDDIVYYEGKAYVCLIGHSSQPSNFYLDLNDAQPKWELMFDGNQWRGDWTSETFYNLSDIVKFKGYLYIATEQHTSTVLATVGPESEPLKWELIATTYNWLDTWTTNTFYNLGDVITYYGITYICVDSHRSAATFDDGLEVNSSNWNIVTRSDNWLTDWTVSTRYVVDDVVRYGGNVYRCVTGHTSADNITDGLEVDDSFWTPVIEGVEYKGDWVAGDDTVEPEVPGTRYKVNDVVKYNHSLYICINEHTSDNNFRITEGDWNVYIPGLGYESVWDTDTEYKKGDIVLYGGYTYTALQNNKSSVPSVNGILQDTGNWELLVRGYKFIGEWDIVTQYLPGDVVRNNGYLYVATDDVAGEQPDDEINWQLLVPSSSWKGEWQDDFTYYKGDIVTYASTSYICVARHTSTASDSRPDIDVEQPDQDYWEVLIAGTSTNVLTTVGDIRTHDDIETVRFGIGNPGNALKATESNGLIWQNFEEVNQIFYVATSGVDLPQNGRTISAPWRSIRYAANYITENLGENKINLQKYNTDSGTVFTMLNNALLQNFAGTLSANAPNLDAALEVINPRTGNPYGDIDGNGNIGLFDSIDAVQGDLSTAALTKEEALAYNDLIDYLNSRADDFIGETTATISDYTPETVPVIVATYPNTTIFVKTGLYQEVLPISLPRNCALVGDELRSTTVQPTTGQEDSDMFYVNNGSGIRNMTLQGLYGTLGDVNQYGTRRPSAGAFVSLDPGEGPNDESVWIISKSPYVQNVTTFGTGCVGMKIDGALHNGGNRSIVANDFTQVVSDGIAYWADNLGRSELVSVFTYYAYIGYLATNGGILRATNGNNSYGTFGTRAEGFNTNETPITALVDNRTQEAQVGIVHTNGSNIIANGYSSAGHDYTNATITYAGAGFGSSASFEEFRNNAIHEVRRLDPADSSTPGGINYQYLLNNSQGGSDTTIVLSAADTTGTPETYVGLRIFIVAGKGVGQYGVITGYNAVTKVANISKEFDGTAGWEHAYPGYPIETVLDSTTRYSIEPRVNIEEPSFSATAVSGEDGTWTYITYGEGHHVAVTAGGPGEDSFATYSTNDGDTWSARLNIGNNYTIVGLVYTGEKFLALRGQEGSSPQDTVLQSANGETWGTVSLPSLENWTTIAANNTGNAVAFSDTQDIAISSNNGDSWSSGSIGGVAQSWTKSAYGNGKFIVIEDNGNGDVAYSTNDGSSWTIVSAALTPSTWSDVTYGNGRFVAISAVDDRTAISFDGITWYENTYIYGDRISYGQGLFFATGVGQTIARSQDGLNWKNYDEDSATYNLTQSGSWTASAYGADSWVVVRDDSTTFNKVSTGAKAFVRAVVRSSRIDSFLIYDPGSGYNTTPDLVIEDPVNTADALAQVRLSSGVLAQPLFANRGTGFTTATATITGDGVAELYQITNELNVKTLSKIPGPGDNLLINGIDDIVYRVTEVLSFTGTAPNYSATIKISPAIKNFVSPEHEENVIIRQQYSQARLTGHDFLDIGTGNFGSTRYPELYIFGETSENEPQPQNETSEVDGGRVFYTSTDQDGNFRVGELFKVEQNTGVVTISADFFELTGLEELSLGGIVVGGSAVVVREFSKEPTFVANSNNIVPTQRAIARYLESRISSGGSDAITNTLIAGQVRVGGTTFSTTSGFPIQVPVKMNHTNGVDGDYTSLLYFSAQ